MSSALAASSQRQELTHPAARAAQDSAARKILESTEKDRRPGGASRGFASPELQAQASHETAGTQRLSGSPRA